MWATFIGSTFVHRPVPGERKSGMPEGTEMPAPVRATVEREALISSARSCAGAVAWFWPLARDIVPSLLFPGPLRSPLAEEGPDAFLRVLGQECGGEALLLGLDALVQVPLVRDPLHLLDRDRGLARELARPGERRVEELVVGNDAVREAVLECVRGRDRVADQVHLERLARADEARQALGASEPGNDPELDLGLAEDRRAGGDPEVACHRELAAAPEGERVDGRDGRDPA